MQICFCDFERSIITPEDDEYEQARQSWNRAIQKYPMAIAYCLTKEDVAEAILWSIQCGVEVKVRNGGHNYQGYSTGNGVLVIDVSQMNHIGLDEEHGLITIGGGVQNGELYQFLGTRGYPFPGGTCPTVGISGYCLGGGWGLSARYLGLGCDSLVEIEMVDAKGRLLKANAYCHEDLFWACRGAGGGNFGVVVSMTFKLPQKVEGVTYFNLYVPQVSRLQQKQFLEIWQNWITVADEKINMQGGLFNTKSDGMYIYGRGIFYGLEAEAQVILAPFYQISGMQMTLEHVSFLEAIDEIGSTYPPYEYFKTVGRFAHQKLSHAQINDLLEILNEPRPQGSVLTSINVYGLGGNITSKGVQETAFYYRNASYIIIMQSVWEDNAYKKENVKWVNEKSPVLQKMTYGSYINFPNIELQNYEWEYYGENKYKLMAVKAKYDPCNVFRFPQSIRIL